MGISLNGQRYILFLSQCQGKVDAACADTALRGYFVFLEEFFEGWLRVKEVAQAKRTGYSC